MGYSFIGATWLILKTDGALQRRAVGWARGGILGRGAGPGRVSLATPLVSPRIFERWFSMPAMLYLLPLPVVSAALIVFLWRALRRLPRENDRRAWVPFARRFAVHPGFAGMAYSFYPYVVPERLDGVPGGLGAGKPDDHPGRRYCRSAHDRGLLRCCPIAVFRGKGARDGLWLRPLARPPWGGASDRSQAEGMRALDHAGIPA